MIRYLVAAVVAAAALQTAGCSTGGNLRRLATLLTPVSAGSPSSDSVTVAVPSVEQVAPTTGTR